MPDTVRYAFYAGAAVLLGAIAWTVLRTREYPPEALQAFDQAPPLDRAPLDQARATRFGLLWLLLGGLGLAGVAWQGLPRELYLLGALLAAYGVALLALNLVGRDNGFAQVMHDIYAMPVAMRRLAVVQFFSWFALFAMWIYTTATVTSVYYGSTDTASAAYNDRRQLGGRAVRRLQRLRRAGGDRDPVDGAPLRPARQPPGQRLAGRAGPGLDPVPARRPNWLLLSMVGVGIAWASILSLPYALLSDSLPARKMGVYMGIFNFFIVIPQLVAVATLGYILKHVFADDPAKILVLGGASMLIAGACVLRVPEPAAHA